MSNSLWPNGLYSLWNSPGQNTGLGCLSLLQWISPTQRLNPGLPHCRRTLCQLSHKGSPKILVWVAYYFSSGSSQPRNWTRVSWIAGEFFNNWAIRDGRTDGEAESPILLALDVKSQLIGKDPDSWKDRSQKKKGMLEDQMVGWHYWHIGCEFEQAPGDGEAWHAAVHGITESYMTEQLNNNNKYQPEDK